MNYAVELIAYDEVGPNPDTSAVGTQLSAVFEIKPPIVIGEGFSDVAGPRSQSIERVTLQHAFTNSDASYVKVSLKGRAAKFELIENLRKRVEITLSSPANLSNYSETPLA